MEKELKIIPPIGYEIDRQKSTFEKIVFKKIPENPKTWEDYCSLMKGKTVHYPDYYYIILRSFEDAYNMFETEERARQFIALGKLLQLRDYWVKGYDTFSYIVWSDNCRNVFASHWVGAAHNPLTFPTKEMAEEFKDCFEDLIKQAYPLV